MIPQLLRSALLALLTAAACNSPSTPAPTPTRPAQVTAPPTNRTLPAADPREQDLGTAVANMLTTEHLLRTDIDDALSTEAFGEFLDNLDSGKMYLLESHIAELRAHETLMDDELKGGDLVLARLASAILAERQPIAAKMVAELLAKPFDFTVDESVEVDPEKLQFAKTDEELRDRWRKNLKLSVLERSARMERTRKTLTEAIAKTPAKDEKEREAATKALAKIPDTDAAREEKARTDLATSYASRFSRLAKREPLESAETFLNAVTSVFDPHTVYLAPAEQANFDIQMSGSLEGIGAVLQEDDTYIRVSEIVPGGASDRQGALKAEDMIMSVAQDGEEPVDVADMRINQVVAMIRGPKGTIVTLVVKKPDDRIDSISITRDVVEIEASYARGAVMKTGSGTPMGLVYLPSFYGNTRSGEGSGGRNATDDVRAILKELAREKVSGVVLDLRGNGGGLLDHARDIAGLFFKTGPVVQTRYGGGETEILSDRDPEIVFDGKVIVLVDRFSASASEIVAAALQDYQRAVVVGTTTHGKGTVQVLLDLNRIARSQAPLGVLKLTIQQFFRINGGSTQWRGVIPDIPLPDPAAHVESGERFLDHAIKWSDVKPLEYSRSPVSWDLPALIAKSAARVRASSLFRKVNELAALGKARRDRTVVPLKKTVWLAQRDADEKALEAADPKIGDGPELAKVTEIGSGKAGKNSRIETWKKSLARDPWVNESIHILEDMSAK